MAKEIYLNGMTADQLSKMSGSPCATNCNSSVPHIRKPTQNISRGANRPPSAHLARDAHRLVNHGKIRAHKIGGRVLIPRQRCQSSLESNSSH